jgi:hypothetical protein
MPHDLPAGREHVDAHYRHTQIGWVILGVAAALSLLVAPRLPDGGTGLPGGPLLAVLAIVTLLFATLTVEVDREAIRLRFGIGLIRKRIPLTEVRAWQAVRNPWYSGWGIRILPGRGVVWNVSGYDAVELALADGRRFRIGTDEPEALVSAITTARGLERPPSASDESLPVTPPGLAAWRPVLLVGAVVLVAVGVLFWFQMQPPTITVRPEGLEVDCLFYGRDFAATDITSFSLESTIPRVLVRTNGFAAAGILRGHFDVEGLGNGLLFVDTGSAPYILVGLRQGFVIVNLPEPERTRALYDEMAHAWPDRASGVP